ncbi:MAG: hypothetical protein RIR00_1874 [Pseudomonadota bacterium]|jgi:hypothetical protein
MDNPTTSAPATPLHGGCACGGVRYRVNAEPVLAAHCHCRHCQVSSGAAYATVMGVPRPAFQLEQGTTASYTYTGDSGNPVIRHFCPYCGCPLFSDVRILPDLWFVRIASLDAPEQVTPTLHIYCDSAQPWDKPEDGLPRFATMPG